MTKLPGKKKKPKLNGKKQLDTEFKTKMVRKLRRRVCELKENFNKEIRNIKTELDKNNKS